MTATPFLRLALAASLASTLTLGAGCGGGGSDGGDTTGPTLTGRDPASNATNVPVTTTVTATFSEAMDGSTLGNGSLTVRLNSGGPDVAGTWTHTSNSVTFTPDVPLAGNQFYRALVASTAKDSAGNAAGGILEWYFTTGAPVVRQLNVVVVGPGTVAFSPSGSSCGPDCANFDDGTVVTLAPTPDTAGDAFGSWGGECAGQSSTGCTLTMSADRNPTATFTRVSRDLTLTTTGTGSGSVSTSPLGDSCGLDCWRFAYGDSVALTPSANADSDFVSFAGDCTVLPCSFTMSRDRSVSAQFDLKTFNVSVAAGANGGYTATAGSASCGTDCRVYTYGTSVTVTAFPNTGYQPSWSGPCSGTSGNSCTFAATAAATVGITFSLIPYNITLAAGANGSVAPSPAGTSCGSGCVTFDYGQGVTFTATPSPGYHVAGWSGACSGTATTCNLSVTGAATVGVTFAINSYNFAVTKAGTGAAKGSVAFLTAGFSCGTNCMTYDHGTSVTVAADVLTGATFSGWSGACTGTGDCVVSVTSATAATATFTLDRNDLTVTRSGAGTGSVASAPAGINCGSTCTAQFDYETSVTLTASPAVGSTFAGWSGGGCTGTGTCTVSVTAATSVDARFDKAQYAVTVAKAGTGTGTVSSAPAGVSCGSTCSASWDYGTSVTLSAAPDGTAVFTGWSGGGCSGTGACFVTVDAAKSVTATFQAKRTISVSVSHLLADGLVLRNNGGDDLTLDTGATSGSFTTQVPDGSPYAVTVFTQPPGGKQQCSVTGTSSGTVSADVSVQVDCTNLVVATYAAAPMWSDYVKAANTGVACDGTETGGYSACVHGGERRSVQTDDEASCANLVAADALGAFDWVCDDTTDPVTFHSTGLKATKRLSDLIQWTAPVGFLTNSVTVTDTSTSAGVYSSPSTVWWSNSFQVDNFVTPADGMIKVFTASFFTSSTAYSSNSGWAWVMKPGTAILKHSSAGTSGALVTFGGNFLWIEAEIQSSDGPSTALTLQATAFSVVRGFRASGSSLNSQVGALRLQNASNCDVSLVSLPGPALNQVGVELIGGGYNRVHDVVAARTPTAAVEVNTSSNNRVWNVVAQNAPALRIANASRNAFANVTSANNGNFGVYLENSSDNVLVAVSVTATARGLWMAGNGGSGHVVGHLTAANTTGSAIQVGSLSTAATYSRLTFFDVVGVNAGTAGFFAATSAGTSLQSSHIHNLVAAHGVTGVSIVTGNSNVFSGVLKVGGNGTDCSVTGFEPGIDGSCANVGSSTATLSTGIGVGASFVGSVTTDDAVNPSDASGVAASYATATSWEFENPFRVWGLANGSDLFPAATLRGIVPVGFAARIHDWSLYAIDPVLRNVDAPVANAGTVLTHTWSDNSTTSFLSGAIELMGDGVGDDDGLCESNETCLYAPNVGAYQGHGAFGDVATISNGAVVNVLLKGYGTNGY